MKKIILTSLIFAICGAAQAEITRQTYFNDDIGPKINYSTSNSVRPYQVDSNTYHVWNNDTQAYTTYTRDGDNVYSSSGSRYTQYGNTLQNNSTGDRYQKTGDIWKPIY